MDIITQIYNEPGPAWSSEPQVADFLADLVYMTNRQAVLELGTFKGATAAKLADVCQGCVTTVDFDDLRSPLFTEHYCCDKCLFIHNDSRTFKPLSVYDFIYFDTAHTFAQLRAEFTHLQKSMTDDCILAFHDALLFPEVREFVHEMTTHGDIKTVTLPTPRGSGLAIATLQ